MLPRKNRIPRKEFPAYTERGFRVFSPLFTGVIYPSSKNVRVSVVVSKKTSKTAVARNRLRRRLYAVVEPYLKSFPHGATIVLYPKIEAKEAPFALLKTEMEQALKKARLA